MTGDELREQRTVYITYLQSKIKAQDWHGVADIAMDLREVDSKLEVLAELAQTFPSDAEKTAELTNWLAMEGPR